MLIINVWNHILKHPIPRISVTVWCFYALTFSTMSCFRARSEFFFFFFQNTRLERVQKRVLRVIIGARYSTYDTVLDELKIESLSDRRKSLCLSFFQKTLLYTDQFKQYFPPENNTRTLRRKPHIPELRCKTKRMQNSPIPYLIRALITKVNDEWSSFSRTIQARQFHHLFVFVLLCCSLTPLFLFLDLFSSFPSPYSSSFILWFDCLAFACVYTHTN